MKKINYNYAVVLAGGQGSRFWPLSRSLEPKQFLSLFTSKSLFHNTLLRIKTIVPAKNIFVVTNQLYFPGIFSYTAKFKIPRENIIFESESKNTAPSIAVACRLISLINPEARIVVLPSDHLVRNQGRFISLLRRAFSLKGLKNSLLVFGISPGYPATGYGYIKIKSQGLRVTSSRLRVYQVEKFLEKPDLKTAKVIFRDKRYLWNSGMVMGNVGVFLREIKENIPGLYRSISRVYGPQDINNIWRGLKPVSFDYGVLEKAENLFVMPAVNLGWSDLGTWAALDKILPKDKFANTLNADTINFDSSNITVFGKDRLVACLGLEDLIIVDTPDALLITRKHKSEEVKRVVEKLKKSKRQEYYLHKTVKRPWGRYTVLDKGSGFKIKLVEVAPQKSLSLQRHNRRSEHWVVVEGKAKVTKGKKSYYVNSNESTYIPLRYAHRLTNPTSYPLKIVEVQSGDYLEEDDIVRIRDDFERI
ncbi:mannose-1-phosphate guanylyltransferase/mannose-6-phosphate isomerase [Candidatus Omnitrophota bacterium]